MKKLTTILLACVALATFSCNTEAPKEEQTKDSITVVIKDSVIIADPVKGPTNYPPVPAPNKK